MNSMDKIKFFGTAGARFVVTRQLRKSGGIWITLDDTNILVDPGPGSLVAILNSRPKMNPRELEGIILTHRHLDHSNDVNIMIEAMTNGGWDKKGSLIAPNEALNEDPVVLKYVRNYVEKIITLKELTEYKIGNVKISSSSKLVHHGSECYGLNLIGSKHTISFISDTGYFDDIEKDFIGDILIMNVVRVNDSPKIDHLSVKDAEKIILKIKPRITILTHFGMTMIKAKPWEIAEKLTKKLGLKVIAANDGIQINLDNI